MLPWINRGLDVQKGHALSGDHCHYSGPPPAVVSPTSRVGFRLGIAGATQLARQMQLGVVDVLTMLMHLNRNASFSFKEEAFIDGVHLACSVNRELLIVILNAVCDFHALGKV